jgi:hypothetical protein
MKHAQTTALLMLGLMVAGLCSGCTSSEGEGEGEGAAGGEVLASSLTELFRQHLETEDDPEVVAILERAVDVGEISQADYDSVHDGYARCMADLGYDLQFERRKNGALVETDFPTDQEALDAFIDDSGSCSEQLASIESLFLVQQGNPDLLADPFDQASRCLVRAGLAPESYDGSRLESDVESDEASPFPFDVDDAEAQECLENAGLAIATGSP